MAIFDKDDDKAIAGPGTVIGSNVKLVGALKDVNDVTIHGVIEGEVASEKSVAVGETAQIKGPVNGEIVVVAGIVRGSVEASKRLEIMATGKVYGNIVTCDLIIHSGAIFIGKSTMSDEAVVERPTESDPADDILPEEKDDKVKYDVE